MARGRRLANLPKAEATDSLARAIAGMPQSRWSLADALLIAARLIDLLPTGRVRGASRTETSATGWLPSARTGFAMICFALGIGYAVSILIQHNGTVFDGSDVATFAAPSLNGTP